MAECKGDSDSSTSFHKLYYIQWLNMLKTDKKWNCQSLNALNKPKNSKVTVTELIAYKSFSD